MGRVSITPQMKAKAIELIEAGTPLEDVAKTVGISLAAVYNLKSQLSSPKPSLPVIKGVDREILECLLDIGSVCEKAERLLKKGEIYEYLLDDIYDGVVNLALIYPPMLSDFKPVRKKPRNS